MNCLLEISSPLLGTNISQIALMLRKMSSQNVEHTLGLGSVQLCQRERGAICVCIGAQWAFAHNEWRTCSQIGHNTIAATRLAE